MKQKIKYIFSATGAVSAFALLGQPGRLELNYITVGQAIIWSIVLLGLIGLSYIGYKVMENIYDN